MWAHSPIAYLECQWFLDHITERYCQTLRTLGAAASLGRAANIDCGATLGKDRPTQMALLAGR